MEGQKEAIIKVRNLSKSFGEVKALNNVSFDLLEGEVFGIIGPNGTGKTTPVNTITGFVKPESWEVFFKNIKLTGLPHYKIADLGATRTFQVVRPFLSLRSFKNLIVPLWSPRARRFAGSRGGDRDAVGVGLLEKVRFTRESQGRSKFASAL